MPCHFYFCPEPPDSFLLPYCEAKEHNRLRGYRTTLLEADSKAQMRYMTYTDCGTLLHLLSGWSPCECLENPWTQGNSCADPSHDATL